MDKIWDRNPSKSEVKKMFDYAELKKLKAKKRKTL